jgi:hypothetical protein
MCPVLYSTAWNAKRAECSVACVTAGITADAEPAPTGFVSECEMSLLEQELKYY